MRHKRRQRGFSEEGNGNLLKCQNLPKCGVVVVTDYCTDYP
jgi:hypothetical protein